jgi:cytochrome c
MNTGLHTSNTRKAVVTYFKELSQHSSVEDEIKKRTADALAKIQAKDLQTASLVHCL